ncbi:MAG: hypothetical protein GVY35_16675 [Bacteroidetes bacterium]|jgi:hypothetical protein|nr:hypothetical protein [Bacteroidota bacterium]
MHRFFYAALVVCITAVFARPAHAQSRTAATLTFAVDEEAQAREQLQRLLSEYDLDPWIVTTRIRIAAGEIPHSHPILTLNTKYLDDDLRQLATFLHEQMHWYESADAREAAVDRAIEDLRQRYPNPPDHEAIGTRSAYSTYLHLMVNGLTFDALRHLLGEAEARTLTNENPIYRWVNQRVLDDTEAIRAILDAHGLIIDPGAE